MTLTEIMLAMLILSISLLPIFGLMTRTTRDSDATLTRAYAINTAKSIFSAVIDDIPFADLKPGSPAIISGDSKTKASTLFPGALEASGGIACNTIASDVRGINYRIFLKAEPINDDTDGYADGEFYFSFYPNPSIENQPNWNLLQNQSLTTENSDDTPSFYSKTTPPNLKSPYRFFGEDVPAGRWGPAEELAGNKVRVDQREISQPDESGNYYLMQRLTLQIRWNMDSAYYKQPDSDNGRPVRLQIITYKANLD